MCCAGAACRQLWATALTQSCRKRGAFSDFPISPSRVRCAASTSRPTAKRDDDDDDMRPHASTPHSFQQASVVPDPTRARQGEYIDATQVSSRCFRTCLIHDREYRRSVSQARLVNVVWRRRRMRPVFRPDSPLVGSIKAHGGIVEARSSFRLVRTAVKKGC